MNGDDAMDEEWIKRQSALSSSESAGQEARSDWQPESTNPSVLGSDPMQGTMGSAQAWQDEHPEYRAVPMEPETPVNLEAGQPGAFEERQEPVESGSEAQSDWQMQSMSPQEQADEPVEESMQPREQIPEPGQEQPGEWQAEEHAAEEISPEEISAEESSAESYSIEAASLEFESEHAQPEAEIQPVEPIQEEQPEQQPMAAAPSPVEAVHETFLSRTDVDELRSRWSSVQTKFVDEPCTSVEQADALVADAIVRVEKALSELRSVLDRQWLDQPNISTEDLRLVLKAYRDLLDRLLAL